MAWLETHSTSGHFNLCFHWQGKKLRRTLKTFYSNAAGSNCPKEGTSSRSCCPMEK
jgi:hypothetical protein